MRRILRLLGIALVSATAIAEPGRAAVEAEPPLRETWPHQGIFGTWDRRALQRGTPGLQGGLCGLPRR